MDGVMTTSGERTVCSIEVFETRNAYNHGAYLWACKGFCLNYQLMQMIVGWETE